MFAEQIWDYYHDYGRHDLPWRLEVTPYGVFVSEVMLQQTQVSRVLERWGRWLERWPSFGALAAANQEDVLREWQGMGYNRRALWLQRSAQVITQDHAGELPRDPAALQLMPGIGPNTAGSIAAFAYNEPVIFIETNIRRVYLHEFFPERDNVHDNELLPLITETLDQQNPREWYWALIDYGAYLAKSVPNPNRRSRHHTVQSKFEGSLRQLRGEVLRRSLAGETLDTINDPRLPQVITALQREGFKV